MQEQEANEILEKLANRELEEHRITKEEFPSFRYFLVQRKDFKHFRGIAQHGGEVVYRYTDKPRS
ncbi:hypothetical protein ELQ35_07890 [Peribacillus cavernae]|uniref:Abortive phage infection protein n=1 Tax=Peribacillus cavernae TaxID=1674310 RepID=A0A433HPH8_9BACI|nr:hypothetical protein [Peribacillus cavernae]MDQ0217284.1 hypothetical protein [Peribacillus cavernae]RUQ30250.1 hypothetical protein ELQ35_07890 [Peribacillus cavernae]